ncbi:MAG: cyclase family protein [Candidatus Taylorbacteria bacterium]
MKIIDISLPLDKHTLIYPGNVALTVEAHATMPGSATHLSKITMGSHTGTHVDAPSHAILGAKTLDQIPLETLVGPCKVLDFTSSAGAIKIQELKKKGVKAGERILAKTQNSLIGFKVFREDYVYLDGDAADYLAELGIALFGIDYLSIKQRGSSDHRPHTSLLSKNIPIIEGLNLKDVEEGVYELFCLPLKFIGLEGAPARVILLDKKN